MISPELVPQMHLENFLLRQAGEAEGAFSQKSL